MPIAKYLLLFLLCPVLAAQSTCPAGTYSIRKACVPLQLPFTLTPQDATNLMELRPEQVAFGGVGDAVESSMVDATGAPVRGYATGTDDTQAFVRLIAAAGFIGAKTPVGLISEQTLGTAFQARIMLRAGRGYLLQTFPYLPDGVTLDCNNASIYITSPAGNGPMFRSNNSGNTPGTVNGSIVNCGHIVYVGSQPSTGYGFGGILGNHLRFDNDGAFGFDIGLLCAGCELSTATNPTTAYNNVGEAWIGSSFDSVPAQPGGNFPSLDNNVYGANSRNNKFGLNMNGGNTTTFFGGSLSNNTVAPVALGQMDFPFLDTLTVQNGASAVCTPNSVIPLTLTGGGAQFPAEAVMQTDDSGHVAADGAHSINAGKGFTSAPAVSVPTGSPGCSTPPTITAHIQAYTGLLPAGNYGASQVTFYGFNIESEGILAQRPAMGFQIVSDASSGSRWYNSVFAVNGSGVGFTRVARIEQGGSLFADNFVSPILDPVTGSTCPFMNAVQGTNLELRIPKDQGDPSTMACNAAATTDFSFGNLYSGWTQPYGPATWRIPALQADRGISTFGPVKGNALQTDNFTPPNYYTYGGHVNGDMWSDEHYLYRLNPKTGHIVGIPWSAIGGDKPADAGTLQ